jgi:anaerobic magnesium-protoporphyrin IX monomethyl ester cyclase
MLLINPAQEKFGGFLSRYMQVGIPVSIGILSAYMNKHGVKVNVFDEEIEALTPNKVAELVKGLEQPYIFGITCLTAHAVRAYQLAEMLKTLYPDSIVIAGGIHTTALPEEPLTHGVDFVVRGEGEEVLLQLHNAIRGHKDYSKVLGITYLQDGKLVSNPDAPLIADINSIPMFPYERFEHPKYDMGFMVSSRGCPYRCNYCSIRMMNGTTYRYLSADRIVEELDVLVNRYNQKAVLFYDDNFCFKKRRVMDVCSAIMSAGLHKKCSFSIQTRADNFYPDVVPLLAEANFKHAGFGMETGVDRLAHIINKEETVQQHRDAVTLAQKYGMDTSLFMIFGLPTETHLDREESYQVVSSMKVQESKYNNLIPYPGTPMFETLKDSPRIHKLDGWSNFNSTLSVTRSIFDKTSLPYVPDTMSEFELKRDIIQYNLKTYFKPRNIFRMLFRKKGIGWVRLPENWYFKPYEVLLLTKTVANLLTNLVISYLPLALTEPIMTALNPEMRKRSRVVNPPKITIQGWSDESQRKFRITDSNAIRAQSTRIQPQPELKPAA